MSKRDKKKLARGTKLSPEHVWNENLDNVVTDLTSVNVNDTDGMIEPQYDTGNSTFRLTWNIPKLTSRWTMTNGPNRHVYDPTTLFAETAITDPGTPYIIPFVLIPHQQYLSFEGNSPADTPQIFMTEFTFGFDQRDEPAFITDDTCGPGVFPAPSGGVAAPTLLWTKYVRENNNYTSITIDNGDNFANANQGKLHYDIETRGPLKFEILQKDMQYFNSNASTTMTDSLYNLEVPTAAFVGRDLRLNPANDSNLNIYMDPYKTYCLAITPPQLHDPDISATSTRDNLALVNLTISVKFKCKMVTRDASTHYTHEMIGQPSAAGGGKTADTDITITSPVADSIIEADTPDGVNRATTILDQAYRDKLRSGYDVSSNVPFDEHLCQDAGYDIIAIPLWNNQEDNIVTMRHGVLASMPYAMGGFQNPKFDYDPTDGPMTRAIVPIDYPFTIHHAFIAANVFTANFQVNGNKAVTHPNTIFLAKDAWDLGQFPRPCNHLSPAPIAWNVGDTQPFTEIGVGVGTGLRGTQYGYRQVLHYNDLRLNDDTQSPYVLDRITVDNAAVRPFKEGHAGAVAVPGEPSWRIYNLPLNAQATKRGECLFTTAGVPVPNLPTQHTAQDAPHFCGQSFLFRDYDNAGVNPVTMNQQAGTSNRFDGSGGGATEMGEDQWLEVRWKTLIKTAAGAAVDWRVCSEYATANPFVNSSEDGKIIHGVGGHWMYLVIKKQVVSNANWQKAFLEGGIT